MPRFAPQDRTFDRLVPPDWEHYEKYPLSRRMAVALEPAPMVWGVNWYGAFDHPVKQRDGRYFVALGQFAGGDLGGIRGGHAIASPSTAHRDTVDWQVFYDQGSEGACVGFSVTRMVTFLNRRRYDARDVYHEAQKVDVWPGEDYEGTSVRAGLEVVRDRGPRRWVRGKAGPPSLDDGINTYRWSNDVNDAIEVLGWDYGKRVGAIPWTNSWGRDYPRVVWVPGEVAQRLIDEDGEVAVPVDR